MATAPEIGRAPCPVCKRAGARVSLSKSGLACLTCERCKVQVFPRGEESDAIIRASIAAKADPAGPPTDPTPTAGAVQELTAPPAAAARTGWGLAW